MSKHKHHRENFGDSERFWNAVKVALCKDRDEDTKNSDHSLRERKMYLRGTGMTSLCGFLCYAS